jgi:hypothetical protein
MSYITLELITQEVDKGPLGMKMMKEGRTLLPPMKGLVADP